MHDPVAIGLLGQISPHKGHDDAIAALSLLGSGYRLLVAGRGEPQYVSTLKEKAVRLPVEFLGFVPLPEFFDKVDLLIVPSWEEPFGIVLLEAMSAGIPVIATDRGGPVEIIPSRLHGLLIPPRNARALADAIHTVAHDEEFRLKIIRTAREHVETNFDIRKIVPRIEDFYRRVVMRS
jgi:glycosyltransferase involved in cell wall biosynthesis